MRDEFRFYNVFPSVVMVGKTSEIVIEATKKLYDFKDEEYTLRIVPKEKRDVPRNRNLVVNENKFNEIIVRPKAGKIMLSYDFKYEQEYKILFLKGEGDEYFLEFSVYALNEDLYGTLPYKGDLHFHSVGSDGKGELNEIAGSLRGLGYDFLCLTDHHKYAPSVNLKKMYEDVDCGFKVFCGEEVHNNNMGYIHIVNFNGKYSVNEILEKDYENLRERLFEQAESLDLPDYIDKRDYIFRKWICDEIRKSGGKTIYPHPYWTYRDEYHSETQTSFYTLKNGMYDIFEVLGGCTVNENNLQVALYNELRAEGVDMPIVGSTDAHDIYSDVSGFNHAYTIVFSKDEDSIPDEIMNKNSVAMECVPGETSRAYGHFRLVKYALFLINNFYPKYTLYTSRLEGLMKAYGETKGCKDDIERINKETTEFKNKFFK